jgi:Protein of unknown function (DUF3455)
VRSTLRLASGYVSEEYPLEPLFERNGFSIATSPEPGSAVAGAVPQSRDIVARMKRKLLQGTILVLLSAAAAAGGTEIPESIKAPTGEAVVLRAHATGYQIYVCGPGEAGQMRWTLKAPEAVLRDDRGARIGKHFAGPTWQLKDGSTVAGKAAAHADSPDKESIPWLLVSATGHTGDGVLARVSSIQRINTRGGKAPADSKCAAAKPGTETRRRYSADYLFYAPAK